jgi:hypothetical protein
MSESKPIAMWIRIAARIAIGLCVIPVVGVARWARNNSLKLYCFFPTLCTAGTSAVFPATFASFAADSSARMPARIPSSA